jgi:hypothetical protein
LNIKYKSSGTSQLPSSYPSAGSRTVSGLGVGGGGIVRVGVAEGGEVDVGVQEMKIVAIIAITTIADFCILSMGWILTPCCFPEPFVHPTMNGRAQSSRPFGPILRVLQGTLAVSPVVDHRAIVFHDNPFGIALNHYLAPNVHLGL